MIVIGYQGIGKSTLAGKEKQYIDLESGNFWVDGQRADNWHVVYCRIAVEICKLQLMCFGLSQSKNYVVERLHPMAAKVVGMNFTLKRMLSITK